MKMFVMIAGLMLIGQEACATAGGYGYYGGDKHGQGGLVVSHTPAAKAYKKTQKLMPHTSKHHEPKNPGSMPMAHQASEGEKTKTEDKKPQQ